ncbi:MAG TPA: TIM barrel protein, partial [Ktedonobacterales bacterium]
MNSLKQHARAVTPPLTSTTSSTYPALMRYSFSTGTFYFRDLAWCLRLAQQAGFDGVEYVIGPDYFIRGEAALARVARSHSSRVLSLHPPFVVFSRLPGVPWPKQGISSWPRTMRAAAALGAPMAVTHTVSLFSWQSPRAERYRAALKQGREAAPHVELTIESPQRGRRRVTLLDDLRALVDLAGEQQCGITLDTCHAGHNG